jgi:hypothetical protein
VRIAPIVRPPDQAESPRQTVRLLWAFHPEIESGSRPYLLGRCIRQGGDTKYA